MPAKETLYGLSDNYPADGAGGHLAGVFIRSA